MENPLEIFSDWYREETKRPKVRIPSACCFSAIGEDGYPNSRFVSLKEVKNEAFVITGSMNSRKGTEIRSDPKVSLTFWWAETERQVRIQGDAERVSDLESEAYFSKRNRDAKIVSTVFNQGETRESLDDLTYRFEAGKLEYENTALKKPAEWAGLYIKPIRIELMEFKETRLHQRTLYIKKEECWEHLYLDP